LRALVIVKCKSEPIWSIAKGTCVLMSDNNSNPIGSVFKGLEKLINVVSDMAHTGENIKEFSGSIPGIDNNKVHSAYNLSFKVGLTDKLNTSSADKYTRTKIEPNVDIFHEENEIRVIILVNSIDEKDIIIQPNENIIIFQAQNPSVNYYKEITIPSDAQTSNLSWRYKNGVITINIPKGVQDAV